MKILTLSNCDLIPSQGSGYVIMGFADGLRARGNTVTLVGPDECTLFPKLRRARSLRLALGMWRKSKRLVRELQPEIVEFWGGESWLATDRLSRQLGRGFKIVAHSNGIEPFAGEALSSHGLHNTANGSPPKWYQGKLRLPVEKAFSKADAVVTVSQPEADYVVRMGFQPQAHVLGIDNALTPEFLGQPFTGERPKTIGYCGSWLARKGIGLLVRDMPDVLRAAPDWSLHLVGVGRDFKPADHFPADLIPRIIVTGFVSEKTALRTIYQSWSIALMPSIYESFGLVAAEAMACGCALVASRTGFAASLNDGEDVLRLSKLTSPHLCEAVTSLIANSSLRQQIARAGWKRVQSLQWADNIAALEFFYQRLLSPANRA